MMPAVQSHLHDLFTFAQLFAASGWLPTVDAAVVQLRDWNCHCVCVCVCYSPTEHLMGAWDLCPQTNEQQQT